MKLFGSSYQIFFILLLLLRLFFNWRLISPVHFISFRLRVEISLIVQNIIFNFCWVSFWKLFLSFKLRLKDLVHWFRLRWWLIYLAVNLLLSSFLCLFELSLFSDFLLSERFLFGETIVIKSIMRGNNLIIVIVLVIKGKLLFILQFFYFLLF